MRVGRLLLEGGRLRRVHVPQLLGGCRLRVQLRLQRLHPLQRCRHLGAHASPHLRSSHTTSIPNSRTLLRKERYTNPIMLSQVHGIVTLQVPGCRSGVHCNAWVETDRHSQIQAASKRMWAEPGLLVCKALHL